MDRQGYPKGLKNAYHLSGFFNLLKIWQDNLPVCLPTLSNIR
jgi:hypothetical protein